MGWLDEEKTGQSFILVPATPVTRKAIGSSSTQWAAEFLGSRSLGLFRRNQSWDSVLGEKGICSQQKKNERELDTLIKFFKFNKHRDFLMSSIRCHIIACRGRYAVEKNHPEVFTHNMAESAQDFFYDLE